MKIDSIITMTDRANDANRKGDTGSEAKWLNAAVFTLRSYLAGDALPLADRQADTPAPEHPNADPELMRLLAALQDRRVLAYRMLRGAVPTALPDDYDPDDGDCSIYADDGRLLGTEVRAAGVVTCYDTDGNAL